MKRSTSLSKDGADLSDKSYRFQGVVSTVLLGGVVLLIAINLLSSARGQTVPPKQLHLPDGTGCSLMWQLVTSMSQDLYGAAGTSNGTYSYHAGGYSFSSAMTLNVFNRYDPLADAWTTLAPMPQAAIMASAVFYPPTNKIFVFGGEDAASGTNYNITRIYDIASNTWTTGANMPDVRSFMASGYNSGNGKIYLVSGYNTGEVTSAQPDTWEYDPVANTFTSRAAFPHPIGGAAFGIINGHLYVSGGRDATSFAIDLTWDYNIAPNTWTARANMPALTNVPGSAAVLGKLWVFGGGTPFAAAGNSTAASFNKKSAGSQITAPETTNVGFTYDPTSDTWSNGPNMIAARSFPSSAAIGNRLIAAGGYNGSSTIASAETLKTNACPPAVNSAVSRKMHTGVGNFDVPLPLTGTPGIECRTGGATNDYTMVVTFANPVTVAGNPQAAVTMGSGTIGSGGVPNGGMVTVSGNVVTIPLTNILDDQTINVTLNGVSDGTTTGDVIIPMTRNTGDTNANGSITSADIAQTKGRIGQLVDGTNFRSDVNASGGMNSSDVTIIKQNLP